MRVLMLGVNHRTAPVELREKLALSGDQLEPALNDLRQRFPMVEFVVLSTCNRTEIYVARPTHQPPDDDALRRFLAQHAGLDDQQVQPATIFREQQEAVRHLFRVCAGLDSMVLGEPQILGQVRDAYQTATAAGCVGPVLNTVFQQALAAGKQVRRETGIGRGRTSVGSVAVDFARQIFDHFDDKTILGLGAGEMAKSMLHRLKNLDPHRLWLVNRSPQRALELADQLGLRSPRGGARPWDDLDELLIEADVVLTSTGSPQPILTRQRLKALKKRRRNRPLFVVDVAVPRDVEEAVGSLSNVYLYNIDDLRSVVDQSLESRGEAVQQCEQTINSLVRACMTQIQHRDLGHLIRELRGRLHEIGDIEQQRTARKLGAAAPTADPDALEELLDEPTHRVINKILHLPLSQMDRRDPDAPLAFYAAALRRLFRLDADATDGPSGAGNPPAPSSPGPAEEPGDNPRPAPSRPAIPQQSPGRAGG